MDNDTRNVQDASWSRTKTQAGGPFALRARMRKAEAIVAQLERDFIGADDLDAMDTDDRDRRLAQAAEDAGITTPSTETIRIVVDIMHTRTTDDFDWSRFDGD